MPRCRNELVPDIEAITESIGCPETVAKQLRRKYDFRPLPTEEKEPPEIRSAFVLEMKEKMERAESREKYEPQKQTVEPVFGTTKKWMGFTQFFLRGYENVTKLSASTLCRARSAGSGSRDRCNKRGAGRLAARRSAAEADVQVGCEYVRKRVADHGPKNGARLDDGKSKWG